MDDTVLRDLNRRFDHAALSPDITEGDISRLCDDALKYGFCTVAVNPIWVALAADRLRGSTTGILSVTGFPLGASRTNMKIAEAMAAVSDGASEIDMVANIGWLVSGEVASAEREIATLRQALPSSVLLKVIIEAGKLTAPQQKDATRAVVSAGAQFVKTSTGFFGGATDEQVKTLVKAAGGHIEVKASGGIRSLDDCRRLLTLGATRLGSSSSPAIMQELFNPR